MYDLDWCEGDNDGDDDGNGAHVRVDIGGTGRSTWSALTAQPASHRVASAPVVSPVDIALLGQLLPDELREWAAAHTAAAMLLSRQVGHSSSSETMRLATTDTEAGP